MVDAERIDERDVRARELLERERQGVKGLARRDDVELPFHELGRYALGIRQAGAVEASKLRQAAPRQALALAPVGSGQRRELTFEPVLLAARKIARRRRGVRIAAHPFGRERLEELADAALLSVHAASEDQACDQHCMKRVPHVDNRNNDEPGPTSTIRDS